MTDHLDQVQLAEWIIRSLDGSITAAEFSAFDRLLTEDQQARRYYIEFVATYVGLVELVGVLPRPAGLAIPRQVPHGRPPNASGPSVLPLDPNLPEQERIRQIEAYAQRQLERFLEQQRAQQARQVEHSTEIIAQLVASGKRVFQTTVRITKVLAIWSLAAMVLLMIGLYLHANRPVGRIDASSMAVWDRPLDPNVPLKPGRYSLDQGYAQLTLSRGAQMILQAPVSFRLEGANRIYLTSGCLTARVPVQAKGFTVQTPGSTVVDFGTEFGLLVGTQRSAEVHVFEGSVGCKALGQPHGQILEQGQAATMDLSGRMERVLMSHRPRWFVRQLPEDPGFAIPGRRLSLADMVGGGSGLGTGLAGQGIDPSTGLVTNGRQVLKRTGVGYAVVPGLPYVDGVFIPDANQGPVAISSTGIIFRDCPATIGTCFETILNGAVFQAGSFPQHPGRLAGRTYAGPNNPSIGMHPNSGITFDLERIRAFIPDCRIERFRAICGISETALEYSSRDWDPNRVQTDFWVLVDGQVRFHKRLGIVPLVHASIEIPISPQDRFLTLVTTSEGQYRYCWAMFAEPALELTKKQSLPGP